ncbi:MAG: non-canonical purine NTP pyrophosphatase [Suilimivivens sp.]|nr:hypothetical protein [Lachnospiraceae bacterium]MDY5869935.1 non-canonical purine NTP pyrophosphatase [Lachnospiraceae bacterium]
MELIYGTGNDAKLAYMRRTLSDLPLQITGLLDAAKIRGIELPEVEENGNTPLENARQKAEAYFALFHSPVFSCDSGLYLYDHLTGELLPEEVQPGIHVRGRGEKRLSDEELLTHYVGLVKKYGRIRARYQNAICLIFNEEIRQESMEENLWGEPFLLTDVPHTKKVPGFPLDGISIDIKTGRYFYDLENNSQDEIVSNSGFSLFFCHFLEKYPFLLQL